MCYAFNQVGKVGIYFHRAWLCGFHQYLCKSGTLHLSIRHSGHRTTLTGDSWTKPSFVDNHPNFVKEFVPLSRHHDGRSMVAATLEGLMRNEGGGSHSADIGFCFGSANLKSDFMVSK